MLEIPMLGKLCSSRRMASFRRLCPPLIKYEVMITYQYVNTSAGKSLNRPNAIIFY